MKGISFRDFVCCRISLVWSDHKLEFYFARNQKNFLASAQPCGLCDPLSPLPGRKSFKLVGDVVGGENRWECHSAGNDQETNVMDSDCLFPSIVSQRINFKQRLFVLSCECPSLCARTAVLTLLPAGRP